MELTYFSGNSWTVTTYDFARCLEEGWGCFGLDYDFTLVTSDDIIFIMPLPYLK